MCVCFVVLCLSLFFATISSCIKDLHVYCCDLWAQLLSLSSSVRYYVLYVAYFHVHIRYNAVARPSVVCLSVVCNVRMPWVGHTNVTDDRQTNGLKMSAMFLRRSIPWPSVDIRRKFYGDRPSETPPLREGGGLKRKRGSKIQRFWPIEGYISETVQDRR